MASSVRSSALEGVRVLDLSNLVAGPMAAMLLADFGADVIKVEDPARGDELRGWGYAKDGVGIFFKMINRNKRLVTCNLRTSEGQELIKRLAIESDVVIEAFRPGRMASWGLGYEDLSQENPGLIMVSVSGYGQTGPYAGRPGFGTVVEAASGYAYVTGEPDGPPLLPPVPLGDSVAAVYAAYGTLLALYNRDVGNGVGQHIDLALYEGLFNLLGPQFVNFDQMGLVQERCGSRLPMVSPRNSYQTADGQWIAIAGSTQSTFERMARALDIEDLIGDPMFIDNHARMENVEELDRRIQGAVGKLNQEEVLRRLNEAAAAVGPINSIADIFADPHFLARGNIAEVHDVDFGSLRMQNVIPRLSATPGQIVRTGAHLGADNEIYRDLLHLSEQELLALSESKVI